jgi:hypothetical protein
LFAGPAKAGEPSYSFAIGASELVLAAPGEFGTQATAGIFYNQSGLLRTLANRVQGGFGQAGRQHG